MEVPMSKASYVIKECQICGATDLVSAAFLGYLPPVNQMHAIGTRPAEQPAYPAEILLCGKCKLVQLSLVVDPHILFPPEYPYTSGTTRILRENFAELYAEATQRITLDARTLVVDIGSNDGTLLGNFKNGGHPVRGIEPTLMANLANSRGIPTTMAFFDAESAAGVTKECGRARVVTATNVFAHIEHVHEVVDNIIAMLDERGVFISESHYLHGLLDTLQYDTIYHEHLRHYSVESLQYLLSAHALEIFHVRKIPTHGGSIRVYAAKPGTYPIDPSVAEILQAERAVPLAVRLAEFRARMTQSKLQLYRLLSEIKTPQTRIVGIGAPSRASTLIHYVGLDDGILDAVLEVPGSYKVGKYMPGSLIPVLDEGYLLEKQPEYAVLLSWHIADELMPKIRAKGYRGKFVVPLPEPRVVAEV
jgi:hypothetical protein